MRVNVSELLRMVKDGASYSQISKSLGISKGVISYHAVKNGLGKPVKIPVNWNEVQEEVNGKVPLKTLSKKYGFSLSAYCKAIDRGEIIPRAKVKSTSPMAMRRFCFAKYGNQCQSCRLTEWMGSPIPLEVEHIDGNSSNNNDENITFICCNCHALTPTYKARNKGNGRHKRMERYREGKSF